MAKSSFSAVNHAKSDRLLATSVEHVHYTRSSVISVVENLYRILLYTHTLVISLETPLGTALKFHDTLFCFIKESVYPSFR